MTPMSTHLGFHPIAINQVLKDFVLLTKLPQSSSLPPKGNFDYSDLMDFQFFYLEVADCRQQLVQSCGHPARIDFVLIQAASAH